MPKIIKIIPAEIRMMPTMCIYLLLPFFLTIKNRAIKKVLIYPKRTQIMAKSSKYAVWCIEAYMIIMIMILEYTRLEPRILSHRDGPRVIR